MPESPELILDKLRDRQVHLPESKFSSTREPRKRETAEEQKPVLPRFPFPLLPYPAFVIDEQKALFA